MNLVLRNLVGDDIHSLHTLYLEFELTSPLMSWYEFVQGTRSALYANGRESISVTIEEVTPRSVGALIALYERAVGLYASIVNINAYHQPGRAVPVHI